MAITFLKAQAASLSASVVDYTTMLLLVEVGNMWDVAASVTGTIAGGITNFLIGRNWVFDATDKAIKTQAYKYTMVWLGNLLLNAWGFYLMRRFASGIDYKISKVLVSLTIGFSYNYFLQKKFVYR